MAFVATDLFPNGKTDGACKNCGAFVVGEDPDQSNHLAWHNLIADTVTKVQALSAP